VTFFSRVAKPAPAFFTEAVIETLFPLPADLSHIAASIPSILSLTPQAKTLLQSLLEFYLTIFENCSIAGLIISQAIIV
jgi:hypothetical protein